MEEITPGHTLKPQATRPVESAVSPAELQILDFPSRIFRNLRKLRVWLPPGYHSPQNQGRRYPVFYLNDGQNLFDPATSFTGVDWRAGQTAEILIREGKIPPLVLVGIDNAQTGRIKEYLPYLSFHPTVFRPLGKRYPEFLTGEAMPFIEQRYRVSRGPDNTALGGSSLGGLIALFTVIERPGIVGRLLAESPSLYVSRRRLLKRSRRFHQWPQKVYLGMGTRESGRAERDQQFVEDVRDLERSLRRAGLGGDRLRVRIDEGASHNEGEWARRFPEALTFLFGD
jgi:predicted alpha/beta superfamily hydrolase